MGQPAYLVPRITKAKLKPIEPDKRLRSKIFSNHDNTVDLEKYESKATIQNMDFATSRSPGGLSKVRSKMYSLIEDSHQTEDRKL